MKKLISSLLLISILFTAGCAANTGTGDTSSVDTTPAVTDPPTTDAPEDKLEMREDQVYAADTIKDADTVSIAFIGGSLTASGISFSRLFPGWPQSSNRWVSDAINYFVVDENGYKIKDKNAKVINVGIPGTTSDYGAVRFSEQILKVEDFEPDVIFMEFSCNDLWWGSNNASLYYENIIRKCLTLDKIPVIIIVHAPYPMDENDVRYEKYMAGIAEKDALAAHYGIKTINVYDYLRRQHLADDTSLDFMSYIGCGEGGKGYFYVDETAEALEYDVHPGADGYALYSAALFEAIEEDYDGVFSKIKFADIYNTHNADFVESSFEYTKADDERIKYEGDWVLYKGDKVFECEDKNADMDSGFYQSSDVYYEFFAFPDGVMQTFKPSGASFTFDTSAAAVAFPHVSAIAGSSATAYLVNEDGSNGEELGRISVGSSFDGMNYLTSWIYLPDDGQEHTVRIVVDDADETSYVFRFGYLIERFNK